MGKNKFKVGVAASSAAAGSSSLSSIAKKGPAPQKQEPGSRAGGSKAARSNKKDAEQQQGAQPEMAGGQLLPFRLAVQPVKAKYGGQGLAKPSTFLNLTDKDFNGKFEKLFYEHIKGWAGNSYTKSRKKQEQSGMLWKQRLNAKQGLQSQQGPPSFDEGFIPKSKKRKKRL